MDHPGLISSSLTIKVDDISYTINVIEDVFESNRLNPMLACNDPCDQFLYEDWAPQWKEYGTDLEEEFQEGELPAATPAAFPASPNSPAEAQRSEDIIGDTNGRELMGREHSPRRKSDKRGSYEEACCDACESVNNSGKYHSAHQEGNKVLGCGPMGSNAENLQQLSHAENLQQLGPSILSRSKSLDLNKHPKSKSGESRSWNTWPNEVIVHSTTSSPSINQAPLETMVNTTSLSKEIEATMEVGEKIGFRFAGKIDQAKILLKKRGATEVQQ
ncbi:hypothetical protein L2E82_37880 [Cichorium intybus]|uniref:Uncharacterized protein n=1 Tax=Cichorium intybus TaxID=13427 RepID=A0ACB9AFI1_CICIN|nr:hypothetical protein L2E82_37880 [Cichorium intybus]